MTPDGLFGLLSSVSCGAFALATDQTVVFWNRRARDILGYSPDRVVGRRCSRIAPEVDSVTLSDDCQQGCSMVRNLRAGLVPGRARMRMRCSWGAWKWLVVTPMVVSGVEHDGPLLVYLFDDSGEDSAPADIKRLIELAGGKSPSAEHPEESAGSTQPKPGPRTIREAGEARDRYRVVQPAEPEPRDTDSPPDDVAQESPSVRSQSQEARLTPREREILSYLALGWETRYIAEELGVSWYTARNHIENLRRKLGATSRLEAVLVAMRLGIITPE